MNAAKFQGSNGKIYNVRPLNWKQLRENRDALVLIFDRNKTPMPDGLPLYLDQPYTDAVKQLCAASMTDSTGASPTPDELEDALDLGNWTQAVRMVLGANGFVDEASAPKGEVQASV